MNIFKPPIGVTAWKSCTEFPDGSPHYKREGMKEWGSCDQDLFPNIPSK